MKTFHGIEVVMERGESIVESTSRWRAFWWQLGTAACGVLLISKVADASTESPQFIDCKDQPAPVIQTVDEANSVDFKIATKFNKSRRALLSYNRLEDGYYVDFGKPGENLIYSDESLEESDSGALQAIRVNEHTDFHANLIKQESQPAVIMASCQTAGQNFSKDYVSGTVVP